MSKNNVDLKIFANIVARQARFSSELVSSKPLETRAYFIVRALFNTATLR